MKKMVSLLFFLVLLCNSAELLAQTEPECIVPDSDKFQDAFYEALLQKGIENYDKAIVSLDECSKLKPNEAAVYSELGKNYLASKNYEKAYTYFEKASQIDLQNKWYWLGMYDVSYQTKNFKQAIIIANKLIEFDKSYQEDLVSLYMYTEQFDKALLLINELNDTVGKSERRELYKNQILLQGKYQKAEIAYLLNEINTNPKIESNYIALIKLYSGNNDTEKALAITKKMAEEFSTSVWTQVSLFKTYLETDKSEKAIEAMNIVLASDEIDSKIKHRMLNEFLVFVDVNPQYASDLEKAVSYFSEDPNVNVAKEIGKYYQNKQQWEKAIRYYELALDNRLDNDVETNLLLFQLYIETNQFYLLVSKATALLEIYPTQAAFYYFSGLGYNQTMEFKKAKEVLETGFDFLIDDVPLEINFNIQLGEAYSGLGDMKKKEIYFAKANQLIEDKNKK